MPNVPPNENVLKIASGLEGRVRDLAGLSQRLKDGQCTEQDFETARKLYDHPGSSEAVRERLQLLGTEIRSRMKQVQQQTPDPEAPDDAGLTLGKMDSGFKKSGHDLLKQSIFPFIEREQSKPDFMQRMVRGLEVSPDRAVASIFVDLSAGERSLPAPLDIVGQALLHARPKISKWVEENAKKELKVFFLNTPYQKWLDERFSYLEESVRAEKAKAMASNVLEVFENAFNSRNENLLASGQRLISILFKFNAENRSFYQQAITFIAQTLTSSRVMSDSQRYLARGLLDTFRVMPTNRSSDGISEEMFIAIDSLKNKQRRQEPSDSAHSAPTQVSPKKIVVQAPQEAPAPALLPPDKNAARLKLLEIMKVPDRKKTAFINCLKNAFKPCAQRMGIDLNKSSFKVVGCGGTSVVIELHDGFMNRPFAAKFDMESIGEGEDAEYASQLAMRAFATHSNLNHSSIVKHIGFDSVPVVVASKRGATSVVITFQKSELVHRAVDGYSAITSLEEQNFIPQSEDIIELMHKMVDPVHFMHKKKITHRDIKPENMMILPPKDWNGDLHVLMKNGTLKFLDLGLARQLSLPEGGVTFSSESMIPGTLPFIAPECFLDGRKTRNPENDVYALGITLYHFITGQNETHPYNVSRGVNIDFNHQSSVVSAMGMLAMDVEEGKNPPSVVSMDDPCIQRFLNQNHGGQSGKVRAFKIVQFVIRMCDPDPKKRPTMDECIAFTESDGHSSKEATRPDGLFKRMFGK